MLCLQVSLGTRKPSCSQENLSAYGGPNPPKVRFWEHLSISGFRFPTHKLEDFGLRVHDLRFVVLQLKSS